MRTSEDQLDGVSERDALAVADGTGTLVEVVILDWDDDHVLASCVDRLRASGIDVVLVVEADQRSAAADVLGRDGPGPGKAFLWSDEGPQVSEVGAPPFPPGAPDPVAWARSWLTGRSAPGTIAVVTEPSPAVLDGMATAAESFPEPVPDPSWRLDVTGFDGDRERDVESWLTVANGRTGTRGSLEEHTSDSSPGFYIAGLFGCPDERGAVPHLVTGPEWTRLLPCAGDEAVDVARSGLIEHRRVLDLRQAIVLRDWRHGLAREGEFRFRSARFASQADRAVVALEAEAEVAGEPRPVRLDADIVMPEDQSAVDPVAPSTSDGVTHVAVEPREGFNHGAVAVSTHEHEGRLERLAAVDRAPRDAGAGALGAEAELARAEKLGLAALRARHRRAWRDRWRDADVIVDGTVEGLDSPVDLQRALRFALYHLISSGDPETDLASIGARSLSGPGYGGRVFWDTEIFLLPFFIWTHPPTARALLSYRHRTLPAARAKARRLGYGGALYAWESADTGDDATPLYAWLPDGTRLEIVTGLKEHHISADVAWAVWQYWLATADEEFLASKGAEIIIETARFWATRAVPGADGRRHITDTIGPDEYHEGVDDNAFTNVMARWNLETAAEVCGLLPEVAARLGIESSEPEGWRRVAAELVDGFDPSTGVYQQFAGFDRLESVKAVDLAPRPFSGEMVLGVDRLRTSQVVKQADVVMLAHMLPDVMPSGVALANYRYYEPRTSHGSSLSPAIHAAVAARLGLLDDAQRYFGMAAVLDLADKMGNASHGVHIATMGGLWQAAVIGFGGVRAERDFVRIDPHLPDGWRELAFSVQWRGTRVQVQVRPGEMSLALDGRASVALGRDANPTVIGPGTVVARTEGGSRWIAS